LGSGRVAAATEKVGLATRPFARLALDHFLPPGKETGQGKMQARRVGPCPTLGLPSGKPSALRVTGR